MDIKSLWVHRKNYRQFNCTVPLIFCLSILPFILGCGNKNEFACLYCNKITEDQKNPYSTETNSGGYLYRIFEANRGAGLVYDISAMEEEKSQNYWFADEFNYHKKFNPYKDEHYFIEWEVRLAKMRGSSVIANTLNNYHQSLYDKNKKEMIELEREVKTLFHQKGYKEGADEFNFYSRNIRTYAAYCWGDIFTIVDVENYHQRWGCHVVAGNFNLVSGKKYELGDLFTTEDYKQRLSEEISKIEQSWNLKKWDDNLYHNEREPEFLMGYKGLVLFIDDPSNPNSALLIEWEKIEDILNEEIMGNLRERE